LAIDATIVPGERGVFDVVVDGRTIFSKHSSHRFPDHEEIIRALKSTGSK
jgi:selT/selW/selH-like putative selenoprotein